MFQGGTLEHMEQVEQVAILFATFPIKAHHSGVSPSLALHAVRPVRRFLDGLRAGFFITIEVALEILSIAKPDLRRTPFFYEAIRFDTSLDIPE